jgi:hypothetical protein
MRAIKTWRRCMNCDMRFGNRQGTRITFYYHRRAFTIFFCRRCIKRIFPSLQRVMLDVQRESR